MAKKGFIPEQIINKLREAEILLNQGATIGEAGRMPTSCIAFTINGLTLSAGCVSAEYARALPPAK